MNESAFHPEGGSIGERVRVVLVSVYLVIVGVLLIRMGRLPAPNLRRVLRARRRPPFEGILADVKHETGNCFVAGLSTELLSDQESISALELFEDGKLLGPAHAAHADIRALGAGRFSHWGGQVYFSSSDNSDPRANGRRYVAREVRR